jgi:diaminobutyrate-2-oxoglutarate transaminase
MPDHGDPRSARAPAPALVRPAFVLLWASETAFDLGSAMMAFALGVWIYQRTGSAEQFAGAALAASLPALALAPLAGALADRFDRRWVIAGCDAVSVLMIGVLAVMIARDRLAAPQLYAFNAVTAMVGAVRTPAYRAAFSAIVPVDRLSQASGLLGLTQSLVHSGAPLVVGYMMAATHGGLAGVVAIEAAMLVGGAVAMFGALSRARHAIRGVVGDRGPIFAGIADSFASAVRYLRTTPAMAGLAAYCVLHEALVVLATSMLTPLVLSSHPSDDLGLIMSCGALGALAGSVLLVALRARRHLMVWVLVCGAWMSLFVMLAGFVTSTLGWCVCAFCALFVGSVSSALAGALWMGRTPGERRGGVFALVGALNLAATCLALWASGRLGDRVFEPALAEGGAWSSTLGAWLGAGPGRGLRALFVVSGAASGLLSLLGLACGRLRRLDAAPEVPPALPIVDLVAMAGQPRTDRSLP